MKPANLIKTLKSAQQAMSNIQTELQSMKFEGTSGGGLVKLTINGKGEALAAFVDPAVLKEDGETVGDLFIAALNAANNQKHHIEKEKLKGVAGKLLPAGLSVPGLG